MDTQPTHRTSKSRLRKSGSRAAHSNGALHFSSARAAGLRWTTDRQPGIRRLGNSPRFRYIGVSGRPIRDAKMLDRIRRLAIPPAWVSVWICPIPHGHLQATGRDARGRKQYRYHARWSAIRNQTKFSRAVAFAEALPSLRKRLASDLAQSGLPRTKVLATVVELLQDTLIRIGNPEYARDNGSYGLTTLRNRHVTIAGQTLRFRFRGKSGKHHEMALSDRRLARIVRRCQELPGDALFQYVNEDGDQQAVESGDVNDYLREMSGEDLTAKDFRTWGGTVRAACVMAELGSCEKQELAARERECIKRVAADLGNTPAVCRKYYVNPAILEAYADGGLLEFMTSRRPRPAAVSDLSPEEYAVLALLRHRGSETANAA